MLKIPTNLPLKELKALLEREREQSSLVIYTLTKSIRVASRPRLRAVTLRRRRRNSSLNIQQTSNLECRSDQEGDRGRARSTMRNIISKSNCQTHPARSQRPPQPSSSTVLLHLEGNRGVLVSNWSLSQPNREKTINRMMNNTCQLLHLSRMMTITLRMMEPPQRDYTLEAAVKALMASDLGKRMA